MSSGTLFSHWWAWSFTFICIALCLAVVYYSTKGSRCHLEKEELDLSPKTRLMRHKKQLNSKRRFLREKLEKHCQNLRELWQKIKESPLRKEFPQQCEESSELEYDLLMDKTDGSETTCVDISSEEGNDMPPNLNSSNYHTFADDITNSYPSSGEENEPSQDTSQQRPIEIPFVAARSLTMANDTLRIKYHEEMNNASYASSSENTIESPFLP